MTISGQLFANYINTFHKTEVQKIILRCLTCKKPNWIKSYAIKHKFCQKLFFQFCKKITWKFSSHKWKFLTISGHLCANYMKIFHKTKIQTVILRCLGRLNLNWIKSYNINLVKSFFLQSCTKTDVFVFCIFCIFVFFVITFVPIKI